MTRKRVTGPAGESPNDSPATAAAAVEAVEAVAKHSEVLLEELTETLVALDEHLGLR